MNQINKDHQVAKEMLATFSSKGYSKTSMEDIGKTLGVSRQSMYKRFGSKEKCYQWTIHTYLADMYGRIFQTLNESQSSTEDTLMTVFDIFIGEAIDTVNRAHGAQILSDVLEAKRESNEDWPIRFQSRLSQYLDKTDFVRSDLADCTAFLLICSSKGLLLEEQSRDLFLKDMKEIISSIRRYSAR